MQRTKLDSGDRHPCHRRSVSLGSKILLLDSSPRIFENPQAGQANHRNSQEYHDLCDLLWKEMRSLTHQARDNERRDILFSALGLVIVWQITAMLVNRPILPTPLNVFAVFIQELGNGLITHFFCQFMARHGWDVAVSVGGGSSGAGNWRVEAARQDLLPHHLFAVSNSKSCVRACGLFISRDRRCSQDHAHLPDPVFPDRRAGARPGGWTSPAVDPKFAKSRRGTQGIVPLYLFARQPARDLDRAASVHWHGGGGALHHRVVRHKIRAWILYLLQRQYAVQLSRHVRRRDRHEPAGTWHVLRRGLGGEMVVQVEVCKLDSMVRWTI